MRGSDSGIALTPTLSPEERGNFSGVAVGSMSVDSVGAFR